jgi:hypothetical protein
MFGMKAIGLLLIVILTAGMSTGCVLMLASAGTGLGVAHAKGNLEVVVEGTPEDVAVAAEIALEALDIHLVSSAVGECFAEIHGLTEMNQKVKVKAEERGEGASKLSIRVETFGNQQLIHVIYGRILENLGIEQTMAAVE